ncbi:hypothetical protein [Microbulbifer taiwanensis]|uniref:Uncharacterized protein n=1 Tax=Microbulbifer taiwanensis TaxID=986746 RepID=A0ABW1YIT6_9GAMM|nr:hypothetical protein [Microbulbifer taiwanensis]
MSNQKYFFTDRGRLIEGDEYDIDFTPLFKEQLEEKCREKGLTEEEFEEKYGHIFADTTPGAPQQNPSQVARQKFVEDMRKAWRKES